MNMGLGYSSQKLQEILGKKLDLGSGGSGGGTCIYPEFLANDEECGNFEPIVSERKTDMAHGHRPVGHGLALAMVHVRFVSFFQFAMHLGLRSS